MFCKKEEDQIVSIGDRQGHGMTLLRERSL